MVLALLTFEGPNPNVADATSALLLGAELVLVGGPTHAHGMSWPSTREQAEHMADADPDLTLEPQGPAMGVREWLDIDLSELDRAREWGASAARAALEELSLDYSRRNH